LEPYQKRSTHSCLLLTGLQDVLECLREIVCRLRGDPLSSLATSAAIYSTAAAHSSPHTVSHDRQVSGEQAETEVERLIAVDTSVHMVEAYEAEGLLGVLEFIIKVGRVYLCVCD
jgi:hypothetical protein